MAARRIIVLTKAIAAESGVVCPSGEQTTNGGFETGDFTGWTVGNQKSFPEGAHIYSNGAGEGTYYCIIHATVPPYTYIEQDFANEVPASCIIDTSTFQILIRCALAGFSLWIYLVYTDASETEVIYTTTEDLKWETLNLKPYVEAGKTLKGIRLENCSSAMDIQCDGVSLIP